MRILIYAPRFHTNLYHFVNTLVKDSNNVKVAVSYIGRSESHNVVKPLVLGYWWPYRVVDRLKSQLLDGGVKGIWELKLSIPSPVRLYKLFSNFRPGLLIIKDYQSMNLFVLLIISKLFKVKVMLLIQTGKSDLFGSKKLLSFYFRLLSLLGVKRYLTPSKQAVKALSEFAVKIEYIPFVFEASGSKKITNNKKYISILSVGKFIRRKDHLLLLQVFKDLSKTYSLKLTIVGEKVDNKYLKEVESYIKNEELSNKVKLILNLSYKQSLMQYKKHDLFVLTSYNEPAAFSIVEAMGNGLAVICSDENGTKEYVKYGKNGFHFKARSYKDLKSKIEQIIKNRKSLEKMGFESRKLWKENHSPEAFIEKFNNVVKNY